MAKVTDLIQSKGKLTYSFEVTPHMSEEEIEKLEVDPAFFSVTWHVTSHPTKDVKTDPMRTAQILMSKQKHVLMHLPCPNLIKADYLKQLLATFQQNNICNLFLVAEESVNPKSSDFGNATELIKFIKDQFGNYFCIGIAGFLAVSDEKLLQLKEKIDSGIDFIITPPFFDVNTFKSYRERCKKNNINVPILPGIFPYESFKQLTDFISLCQSKVSDELLECVKNMEVLKKPCLEVVRCLIQALHTVCYSTHFHFFTLDKLENVNKIVQELLLNQD